MGGPAILAGCAAMIIEVTSEGGIGGLATGQSHRSLQVDAQPQAVQTEYCAAFSPEAMAAAAAPTRSPGGADRLIYTIKVTDDDGAVHRYTVSEGNLPPETLDLIDRME